MKYKRPESVLVVVYTSAGEVLLLRRADVPDFWQSVTGSLRPGESPSAAARRELAEETGLSAEGLVDCHRRRHFPIQPGWRARYADDVTHNTEHEFRLALTARVPLELNAREHLEAAWLPRADAVERAASWTNRAAIRALATDPADTAVVLVHGLWIGPHSMRPLARRLRRAGFRTYIFRYRSTRVSPARAAVALAQFIERIDARCVHLVAHSLGGIVLAHLLDTWRPGRIGRAVLLGSPMRGSRGARGLEQWRLGWTLGAAREQGLLGGVPDWARDVPVAVIAGTRPCGPGRIAGRLPWPHDGTVALRETRVAGAAARRTLRVTHFGLVLSRRVAESVVTFLHDGRAPWMPHERDGEEPA